MVLKSDQSLRKTQLGRVKGKKVVPLEFRKAKPYGVAPRNAGATAFPAGSADAAGGGSASGDCKGHGGHGENLLFPGRGPGKAAEQSHRGIQADPDLPPNAQFDDDIGFLPGDEQEKISPLMRPVIDNLEQLIDSSEEERFQDEEELSGKIEEVFARGIIQAEALNFIRGRSFVKRI